MFLNLWPLYSHRIPTGKQLFCKEAVLPIGTPLDLHIDPPKICSQCSAAYPIPLFPPQHRVWRRYLRHLACSHTLHLIPTHQSPEAGKSSFRTPASPLYLPGSKGSYLPADNFGLPIRVLAEFCHSFPFLI